MGLRTEWVRYGSGNVGYFCIPERASGPLPAIVVIQEAWGVDAHIEDVTRRLALAGYAALAPDVYARDGQRPAPLRPDRLAEVLTFVNAAPQAWMDPKALELALGSGTDAERGRITEAIDAVKGNLGSLASLLPGVVEAARWLRHECPATRGQRVGSVGFCMGGALSGRLACEDSDLAAAVVFYGAPPPAELVASIQCPVLGLYGALDARITPQVPVFEETMKRAGKRFESVVYEGAQHAFFNDCRPVYEVRAARDAFVRTLQFLRSELAG